MRVESDNTYEDINATTAELRRTVLRNEKQARLRRRLAFGLFAAVLVVAALLIGVTTARAAEPSEDHPVVFGEMGCATSRWDGEHHVTVISTDGPLFADMLGQYLIMQWAWNAPNSDNNLVSVDTTELTPGDVVTACTNYVADGVIPEGQGAAYEVQAATIDEPDTPVLYVRVSSFQPSPDIAGAWIDAHGFIAL